MSSLNYNVLNVRAKTRQVVDHHYDDAKPGKPLYLMIPGGLIALASLALIVFIAYLTWIRASLPHDNGLLLIGLVAPFYIGGVFLFSYGYELYNLARALRLTAIIVFITFASVVIVAVLAVALGAMGEQASDSSGSSRSRRSSSSGGGRSVGGMGWGMGPIILGGFGGLGSPMPPVTREVVREVPAEPPKPQPISCPYCGSSYVPSETNFECPNCGAATPKELLPLDNLTSSDLSTKQ